MGKASPDFDSLFGQSGQGLRAFKMQIMPSAGGQISRTHGSFYALYTRLSGKKDYFCTIHINQHS